MWGEFKQLLMQVSGMGANDLHVVLGIVIYAGLGLALRRIFLPLGVLSLVQLANEGLDMVEDIAAGSAIDSRGLVFDTWATLAWPTVLAAGAFAVAVLYRLFARRGWKRPVHVRISALPSAR